MNCARLSTIVALVLAAATVAVASKKWCCTSTAELRKCTHLRRENKIFRQGFTCVQLSGTPGCVSAIRRNLADMMFLDGGDIFRHRDQMIVVAAENYGGEDASYFAVAVVPINAPSHISMHSLNGLKSCHTGIGKTSGWNTPMGFLARRQNIRDADGLLQLADPFVSSCAPGANNPVYQSQLPDSRNFAKWCALCIGDGDGQNVCDRSADEQFYGYNGAFQCMKSGRGDVAFVKHVTVPEDERDDFSLLCADGSRAHPDDWRDCNLAKVPAHGLIMRVGTSEDDIDEVVESLQQAKESTDPETFLNYYKPNLLWKSSTKKFVRNDFTRRSPEDFLGEEYYCNMLVVTKDPNIPRRCL